MDIKILKQLNAIEKAIQHLENKEIKISFSLKDVDLARVFARHGKNSQANYAYSNNHLILLCHGTKDGEIVLRKGSFVNLRNHDEAQRFVKKFKPLIKDGSATIFISCCYGGLLPHQVGDLQIIPLNPTGKIGWSSSPDGHPIEIFNLALYERRVQKLNQFIKWKEVMIKTDILSSVSYKILKKEENK